jgi:hypothetical protein
LLAVLLPFVLVIPGAIANSAITAEWNAVLDGTAPGSSINLTHAGVAILLAPGIVLGIPIQLFLFKIGIEHHFWFWINVGQAIVSWIFYFGVILLILLWRAWRRAPVNS